MPYPFDQWHDWLRSTTVMLSGICCIELIRYGWHHRHRWAVGEVEDWFVWFSFAFFLIVLSIDGLIEDLSFSVRTVIPFVLSLILTRGIYRKRKWIDDQNLF